MRWHIVKASRCYEYQGYSGPSCAEAGVRPGRAYTRLTDAIRDAGRLTAVNPIGFLVVKAVPPPRQP